MTDRFLPDKAIDALDEAGLRVHIIIIDVPKQILELEKIRRSSNLKHSQKHNPTKKQEANFAMMGKRIEKIWATRKNNGKRFQNNKVTVEITLWM